MKYLDVVAWMLLLPAGFFGSVLMMHMVGMNHAPKKITMTYIALMIAGLLLLAVYAFFTENKEKQIDTLLIFLAAAVTALFIFRQHKKRHMFHKPLVFLYAAFSMSGLIWLSIHVLNELK